MSNQIKIQEEVMSTPYDDNEHPSIRFYIKENEDVTKHVLFYKTDKKNSFSEERKSSDILFDMFKEIQKLPKVKNKEDENDIETFKKFINLINIFIPHIIINSNSETNSIQIEDVDRDITIEQLHEVFKVASKGKRKAMLDRFNEKNP